MSKSNTVCKFCFLHPLLCQGTISWQRWHWWLSPGWWKSWRQWWRGSSLHSGSIQHITTIVINYHQSRGSLIQCSEFLLYVVKLEVHKKSLTWIVTKYSTVKPHIKVHLHTLRVLAMCVPSMLDTKWTLGPTANDFSASVTMRGPRSEPPMPMFTTSVIALPV